MEGAGFSHFRLRRPNREKEIDGSTIRSRLAEPVNQRPMRAFLRRFFHRYDDEITASRLRNDMCGGEVTFLPAVRLFGQFSFRIVNVNRNLGPFDFAPHPKPVLVPLEQLLPDGLFLAGAEVTASIIFADL